MRELMEIYESVCPILKNKLDESSYNEIAKEKYMQYLEVEIKPLLERSIAAETEEGVREYVLYLIKQEKALWEELNAEQILHRLEGDEAFDYLCEFSRLIFLEACECKKQNVLKDDDNEYLEKMEKLVSRLDEIKPMNVPFAQEILSETVLDIEYCYGKSTAMSLRLGRE